MEPMDTAPRDGSLIEVVIPSDRWAGEIVPARWNPAGQCWHREGDNSRRALRVMGWLKGDDQ